MLIDGLPESVCNLLTKSIRIAAISQDHFVEANTPKAFSATKVIEGWTYQAVCEDTG